ncbi:MAG TPA: hypothetical protein VLH40_00580, partial [Atribacteraceae bacterium]|nr:hypothetical protein [Atribacteraceae bacterium]
PEHPSLYAGFDRKSWTVSFPVSVVGSLALGLPRGRGKDKRVSRSKKAKDGLFNYWVKKNDE